MGELLRAVLEKKCLSSNPAFYGLQPVTLVLPGVAGTGVTRIQSRCELKTDVWFLMMGYMQYSMNQTGAGTAVYDSINSNQTLQLSSARNSKQFSLGLVPRCLLNQALNQPFTLPEYVLWEPNDTIIGVMDIQNDAAAAGTRQVNVVLQGIEYRMPEGVGYSNGR